MAASFSSWPHSPILAPLKHSPADDKDRQKRPRHRHSPSQLAALNDLYDKSEHPALDERSELADRLGMETKTVNAWFQNKRASAKKRSRGGAPYDLPPLSSNSSSTVNTPRQADLEDFQDGDFPIFDNHERSSLPVSHHDSRQQPAFYSGTPEHTQFFADSDTMPRKMRLRPSPHQTDALKRFYKTNPHPTKEQREDLGERIGMRYQSITNWFQNQRSLAKKRNEEADQDVSASKKSVLVQSHESRTFSAFPPPSTHPSLPLSLSPPSNQLSRPTAPRARRSPVRASSALPLDPPFSSRGSTPASSSAPYRNVAGPLLRPRRTRPEPYQLDALKDLFTRTPNPSIEERSALALEIGMDLGKVTNWFRNLRQTARKRAKKGDDDDDSNVHSSPVSRSGTPSFPSSSSSSTNEQDDQMDLDDTYEHVRNHNYGPSDMGSDDEYQEAVTPSPEPSPPPIPSAVTSAPPRRIRVDLHPVVDPSAYPELDKASAARFSGVKLDDALLLLSFHHHIAH